MNSSVAIDQATLSVVVASWLFAQYCLRLQVSQRRLLACWRTCFKVPPPQSPDGPNLLLDSAVSGAQQVNKLNWPLAEGVWSWDKCNFLPNSDAPATSYGSSIAVFFHSLNSKHVGVNLVQC